MRDYVSFSEAQLQRSVHSLAENAPDQKGPFRAALTALLTHTEPPEVNNRDSRREGAASGPER
jgi:hypothetical protein